MARELGIVPIRSIQADGGNEFMAEFENVCQQRRIAHYAVSEYL
ncbi:MAG: hypothetical protein OXI60_05110 [Acidiferrobacterales bacterium]|nr:hypothetical protein [Acidiferrobacterales bacterium]